MTASGPRGHGGRSVTSNVYAGTERGRPLILISAVVLVSLLIGTLAALSLDLRANRKPLVHDQNAFVPVGARTDKPKLSLRGPGTNLIDRCDQVLLAGYLRSHPRETGTWVNALNSDPGFVWRGQNRLRVEDAGAYAQDLTPLVLGDDLTVTDHFFTGKAITVKAVLPHSGRRPESPVNRTST